MPKVKIVEDFNFIDFLSLNEVYKRYIRNKGEAMVKVIDTSIITDNRLKIKLDSGQLKKNKLVLVFKVKNKIYNIPVEIKDMDEDDCFYVIEKNGKVICIRERRDYERVELNKKVEYYTLENRIRQFYKGLLSDISASGAKLVTKHELNTKNPVMLNTKFIDLPLDELGGKIVWKEKNENKYFNGIHFEFKSDEQREQLINYLY